MHAHHWKKKKKKKKKKDGEQSKRAKAKPRSDIRLFTSIQYRNNIPQFVKTDLEHRPHATLSSMLCAFFTTVKKSQSFAVNAESPVNRLYRDDVTELFPLLSGMLSPYCITVAVARSKW